MTWGKKYKTKGAEPPAVSFEHKEKNLYWLVTFTNNSQEKLNLKKIIKEIYQKNNILFKEDPLLAIKQSSNRYSVLMRINKKELSRVKKSLPKGLEYYVTEFSSTTPYLPNNSSSKP